MWELKSCGWVFGVSEVSYFYLSTLMKVSEYDKEVLQLLTKAKIGDDSMDRKGRKLKCLSSPHPCSFSKFDIWSMTLDLLLDPFFPPSNSFLTSFPPLSTCDKTESRVCLWTGKLCYLLLENLVRRISYFLLLWRESWDFLVKLNLCI